MPNKTIEILRENVQNIRNSIVGGSEREKAWSEYVTDFLRHSETLSFLLDGWKKFEVADRLFTETDGTVVTRESVADKVTSILDDIDATISGRLYEEEFMRNEARRLLIEDRRHEYIESLGDEVKFVDFADWSAEDPFFNLFVEAFDPECDFVSPVSGDISEIVDETQKTNELSDERKEEIRAKWEELSEVGDEDVIVPTKPEYNDYDETIDLDISIPEEDVESMIISIMKARVVDAIATDDDCSELLDCVTKVLRTLPIYKSGSVQERGDRHCAALVDIAMKVIRRKLFDVDPSMKFEDYRFVNENDPIVDLLRRKLAVTARFVIASSKRLIVESDLVLSSGVTTVTANLSVFDL